MDKQVLTEEKLLEMFNYVANYKVLDKDTPMPENIFHVGAVSKSAIAKPLETRTVGVESEALFRIKN